MTVRLLPVQTRVGVNRAAYPDLRYSNDGMVGIVRANTTVAM